MMVREEGPGCLAVCEPIVEVMSIDKVLKTCTVQYYRITVTVKRH